MKASFLIFAVVDLLMLALTAAMGLMIDGRTGYARHVLLGVLAGLFTCFVHVVVYMYFVVQSKIVEQAIEHDNLDARYHTQVGRLRTQTFQCSMAGIFTILLTAGLGAAIDSGVSPNLHLLAAMASMFIEGGIFFIQFTKLDEYRDVFREAFGEE